MSESEMIEFGGNFSIIIKLDDSVGIPVNIFERAAEPDFPYWNVGEQGEHLPMRYEQVVQHLTHNILRNGVHDISELDGWADFPVGAVTFYVDYFELDS